MSSDLLHRGDDHAGEPDGGDRVGENGVGENERPRLLFYCQHAVGLGHLARSLALAEALAATFDVVLLNGGRLPEGTRVPAGVELINLPPLGHDADFDLVSHDATMSVDEIVAMRPRLLIDVLHSLQPDLVLIELFPFGRKKFRFELLPLLDAITAMGRHRPLVACSLRDILVNQRRDQAGHDDKASKLANRYLDTVLVHADPAFARLEDSFKPATALRVPVIYTGFVAPEPAPAPTSSSPGLGRVGRQRRVLVSAGGGMVGAPLVRAAVTAHPLLRAAAGLTTTIVTGPFAPAELWEWAVAQAEATDGLEVVRYVEDLCAEMARSAVTVSQCGYNTAMDIARAGTPAVVVPYAEGREDEQRRRAAGFERLGIVRSLAPETLGGVVLADAVLERLDAPVASVSLDLNGRHASALILEELVAERRSRLGLQRLGRVGA